MDEKQFRCKACGWEGDGPRTHCPRCLCGIHTEADEDGYECEGTLEPVSVWVKPDDRWDIILRCRRCGEMVTEPKAPDDDPIKVLSIASRPLAMPPFPIEKMGTLMKLMGGQGQTGGKIHESGE